MHNSFKFGRSLTGVVAAALCVAACSSPAPSVSSPQQTESVAAPMDSGDSVAATMDSDDPVVVGASDEHLAVIFAGFATFAEAGLDVGDVKVVVYQRDSCPIPTAGRYTAEAPGRQAEIILCAVYERLVLHELAHAWDWTVLDAERRAEFQALVDAPSWLSKHDLHDERGAEVLADTLAYGLMSSDLPSRSVDPVRMGWFEAVTGFEAPRLARVVEPTEKELAAQAAVVANAAGYKMLADAYRAAQTSP